MKLMKKQLKIVEKVIAKHPNAALIAPHTHQFYIDGWTLSIRVGEESITIMWWDRLGTMQDGEACFSPKNVNKTVSKALKFFGIKD